MPRAANRQPGEGDLRQQKDAQTIRIDLERPAARTYGAALGRRCRSTSTSPKTNARKAEADGEAKFVELTGAAAGSAGGRRVGRGRGHRALGLARAKGYEAQIQSLGSGPTAIVAVANAVAEGKLTIVPEVLVTGGGGAVEGLAATLMRSFNGNGHTKPTASK